MTAEKELVDAIVLKTTSLLNTTLQGYGLGFVMVVFDKQHIGISSSLEAPEDVQEILQHAYTHSKGDFESVTDELISSSDEMLTHS